MLTLLIVLSMLLAALGAWLLYLASPQQVWRAAGPWPARRRWLPGTLALLLSVAILLGRTGTFEAVLICCCVAMFVWSLAPFLAAWRTRSRRSRP